MKYDLDDLGVSINLIGSLSRGFTSWSSQYPSSERNFSRQRDSMVSLSYRRCHLNLILGLFYLAIMIFDKVALQASYSGAQMVFVV